MSFGFRYHLASLMAVFFALVLGILIGGSLFQDDVLVEEQGLMILEMEERFTAMQADLTGLQNRLNSAHSALGKLQDLLCQDLLGFANVSLAAGDDRDSEKEMALLEQVLKQAGARLKRLGSADLARFEAEEGHVLISWLKRGDVPPDLEQLHSLSERGIEMVFVWGSYELPFLDQLPPSLQIDNADTALGRISLVFGISSGSKGHYGTGAGAKGLFP